MSTEKTANTGAAIKRAQGDTVAPANTFFDTVEVQEAIDNIGHWSSFNKEFPLNQNFIKAFSIEAADIIGIYEMIQNPNWNVNGCRIYLGMTHNEAPPGGVSPTQYLKLYLVGVEGMDIRNPAALVAGSDMVYHPETGHSMVYDFSCPCPSTCDNVSPLNNNVITPKQDKRD